MVPEFPNRSGRVFSREATPMRLNLRIVAGNIRRATTEELLDRLTVYRPEMEPAALDLMEGELARRGVTPDQIEDHDRERRETAIFLSDGTAVRCSVCNRPAVSRGRGWFRLLGVIPVIPRLFAYCDVHGPGEAS
jgi:hypothetical protein